MRRTWTIIGVRDVPASFAWYHALFGRPETAPAHDHFGQILDDAGASPDDRDPLRRRAEREPEHADAGVLAP